MPPTSPRTGLPTLDEPFELERVPWSILGHEFIASWGQPRGKLMPEHLEVVGPTGSGKSYLLVDSVRERVRRRKSSAIYVATKAADDTIGALGWPIEQTWRGVRRHDQCVYWPRTKLIGEKRKQFQAERVGDLLARLWQPHANTVIIFDEFAYLEGLGADMRAVLQMYLREGRSHGLTVVAGKQRIQGVQRDMHSETDWKFAFKMNDREDNERLAELLGERKLYLPIIDTLDREKHEFIVQHKMTGTQYISWVDSPLSPKPKPQRTGYRKAA